MAEIGELQATRYIPEAAEENRTFTAEVACAMPEGRLRELFQSAIDDIMWAHGPEYLPQSLDPPSMTRSQILAFISKHSYWFGRMPLP